MAVDVPSIRNPPVLIETLEDAVIEDQDEAPIPVDFSHVDLGRSIRVGPEQAVAMSSFLDLEGVADGRELRQDLLNGGLCDEHRSLNLPHQISLLPSPRDLGRRRSPEFPR